MLLAVVICSILVLAVLYVQVKWANDFVSLYRNDTPSPEPGPLPHVGVVLSLRGADPYLEDCLRGLMSLDYPSHEIRIIVDNEVDPAFEIVNRVRDEMNALNVSIELLDLYQETSSLKNSALIQGINGCSDECEVYAWLDSDTVPYSCWLRDLVGPLQHPDVGAACGIRWYAPPTQSLANYVRHIWNAAAILQMVAFEIGWGGAFAIRRSVVEAADLKRRWERTMTEDTVASNAVLANGQRVAFVAAATMPNPESATLSWCLNFITRQLQLLRYYHDAWRSVLLFGLVSGAVVVGDLILGIIAFMNNDYLSGTIGCSATVTFGVVAAWLMRRSECRVMEHLQDRSIGGISVLWRLIVAAPVTQTVHVIALVRTYLLSSVTWRGIHYEIRSGTDLTRTNYEPYVQKKNVADTDVPQHSL